MESIIFTEPIKKEIMYDIAEAVIIKAKNMCPTDKGDLLASIKYKIEGNVITIMATDESAEAMEYGLPPTILSPPEKAKITMWAKRHGIKKPTNTQKYISEHGIDVGTVESPLHVTWQGRNSYRPFLRPAIFQTEAEFKDIVKGVIF